MLDTSDHEVQDDAQVPSAALRHATATGVLIQQRWLQYVAKPFDVHLHSTSVDHLIYRCRSYVSAMVGLNAT